MRDTSAILHLFLSFAVISAIVAFLEYSFPDVSVLMLHAALTTYTVAFKLTFINYFFIVEI